MQKETKKSKAGLMLGLGLGVAVVAAGFSSCGGTNNKKSNEETEAYKACTSIADYRAYMNKYGTKGIHYNDAKNVVDRYVADSAEKAVARNKAIQKAEAEEREDEFYMNCTSLAGCKKYLEEYPRGKYVDEVKELKAEFEKQASVKADKAEEEAYKKCTTIAGCNSYLKSYPNGKYAGVVNKKKADLEKKEAEAKKKDQEQKKDVKPVTPKKTEIKPTKTNNNNNGNNNSNGGNSTVKPKTDQNNTTPKNETNNKPKAVKIKKQ